VVSARASLEDDRVVRADDVKITDPTASPTLDITLDAFGKFTLRPAG
jgi:hypothetical protein